MTKLSEDQKNEIKKLFPLNPQLSYDKHDEDSIFIQLEHILKDSCVSTNETTKSTKESIRDQIKILETIRENLERIQRGIKQLTPTNQYNLNDAFSFEIFSEIKATKEKLTGNTDFGMEWHFLHMEHIFKTLSYKSNMLADDMKKNRNSNTIFYQKLCDFWERQRLTHSDIKDNDDHKFVGLVSILLNKNTEAARKEIQRLKIQNWDNTYVHID